MLSYPAFQVDGAPSVGTFRLPFEVYLPILVLGVSIGHCSNVQVPKISVKRFFTVPWPTKVKLSFPFPFF